LSLHPKDKELQSWDEVTSYFKQASREHPAKETLTVNFTQHCEITLALAMALRLEGKKNRTSRIEIGVSKASCQWCHNYATLLTRSSNYIVIVRGTHGKQPDGWLLPPNGPKKVTNAMVQRIQRRLDDIIDTIKNRRLSDSLHIGIAENPEGWDAGNEEGTKKKLHV
jgi:hypothetical protein